jgi:teichoic acid transport system ATP-binding protein
MHIVRVELLEPKPVPSEERTVLVEGKNIGVKYVVGSRREDVQSRAFDRLLRRGKKNEFWALRDVSLAGYSGDILGIIGSNGAGKTRLCRLISRLLRPDIGSIQVEGKVSALLSLGTGFNPILSGRENIFLNGMMLGFSKRHINDIFDEIVEFSGLGHFIEEPVKNYSSGMKSRLGFSIASTIRPDILVIDEALSAGDVEFSGKAGKKLQEIIGKSRIVIVVTHQMSFVEKYCTRALWIDAGMVRAEGLPGEVVALYREEAGKTKKQARVIDFKETERRSGRGGVVEAKNLGVKFSLRHETSSKKFGNDGVPKRKRAFWALEDISFRVDEGEILGIIGRNGAGKTTLCKVLTGILRADAGKIFVDGDITALLTFGAGFNIQLTGRDNTYLNGMMLGIQKKNLKGIYPDIVEFSGLAKFMDQPVKNYSSGMRSRLGFSIAAMIKPDVFIIDEALSAGDLAFYEKASARIQELMASSKAAVVVTHSTSFVEKVCTRAIWLDHGTIKFDGKPKDAVNAYLQSVKH